MGSALSPRAASRARLDRVLALALPPLSLALALIASAPSAGCGGAHVREPPRGTESPALNTGTCVDYPPPAAKVDEPPAPPDPRAVWLDGEWNWRVHRWIWEPGAWKAPPAGSVYVRPRLDRLSNGALVWWPGHWRAPGAEGSQAPPGVDVSASASHRRRPKPVCPPPMRPVLQENPDGGAPNAELTSTDAAGAPGSAAPPHEGPIRVYPADAPSSSGKIVLDGAIPASADARAPLIQPPP